jgi:integrator complex subunit 9
MCVHCVHCVGFVRSVRIRVLGSNPRAQCTVVELHDSVVMLDCALECASLTRFAPNATASTVPDALVLVQRGAELFVRAPPLLHTPSFDALPFDLSRVDALLLSHARHALALPFLLGRGFRGRVLGTAPVLQIVRQLLTELVDGLAALTDADYHAVRCGDWQRASLLEQLPDALRAQLPDAMQWLPLFGADALDAAVERMVPVAFHERVRLAANVVVTPTSSGHSLGAANWTIQSPSGHEKLVYVIDSCPPALNRYPLPLDVDALRGADVMLLGGVGHAPQASARFVGFVEAVDRVVRGGGGCVLVPSFASGVSVDLILCLEQHFRTMNLRVPMVLIGSSAAHAVAYADVSSEWVCEAMQARAHASYPPFAFRDLMRRRSLLVHATLEEADRAVGGALLRHRGTAYDNLEAASAKDGLETTSCVVFAGDPSLRFGDALRIMQLWRDEPRNAVIVTEGDCDLETLLVPFQPMSLQAFNCTADIDPRLALSEVRKLVADLKPKRLLAAADVIDRVGSDCIAGPSLVLAHADVLALTLEQSVERAYVDAPLAATLHTATIDPHAAIQLTSEIEAFAQAVGGAATHSLLFVPFRARTVASSDNTLLLKASPGDASGELAPADESAFAALPLAISRVPLAPDVIDAASQRFGSARVRFAGGSSSSLGVTGSARKRRRGSERTEVHIDALRAVVALDPEHAETVIACNESPAVRALLVEAVSAAAAASSAAAAATVAQR